MPFSEGSMWLWVLLVASLAALFRVGLRPGAFTWGLTWLAHLAGVALLAGLGLWVPVLAPYAAWIAGLGFVLLIGPGLGMRMLFNRLYRAANQFDIVRARLWLLPMRLLFGHLPASRLATAQVEALACVLAGDRAGAEACLRPFDAADAPAGLRVAAQGIRLYIRLYGQDWAGLVAAADAIAGDAPVVSVEVAGPAARGSLEMGDGVRAVAWLGRMQTDVAGAGWAVSQALVPVYALVGASGELESTLGRLGARLPHNLKGYWRARCLAANGEYEGAIKLIQICHDALDPTLVDARHRIEAVRLSMVNRTYTQVDESARVLAAARELDARAWHVTHVASGYGAGPLSYVMAGFVAIPSLFVIAGLERWLPGLEPAAVKLFTDFALVVPAVKAGEWWRLFSYMLLHGNMTHLLLNLLALVWLGPRVQRLFGRRALLLAFLVGGFVGGLAHAAFATVESAVGCSGGVLALVGMVAVGLVRSQDLLPARLRRQLLIEIGTVITIQLVADQFVPHVAAAAHLGGLVAGVVLGMLAPVGRQVSLPSGAS